MSGLQQSSMRPLRLLPAPAPVPESLHRHHQPDPKAQIDELVGRMAARERPEHRGSGHGATRNHEGMYSLKKNSAGVTVMRSFYAQEPQRFQSTVGSS